MSAKALENISVIDLSEYISGPYCARLLGAFGAEVLKVEAPGSGDRARGICQKPETPADPEKSPLFLYLNTNKKSITLDLQTRAGKDIFMDLVKDADVVIENAMPGTMDALGLGYEVLERINPRLVMVSVTDFGQTGIYRDYTGGRLVGYALGGYMFISGEPGRQPLAGGGNQPAYQGGLKAYIGVMAALMKREATGKGDYIDISIMECMAGIHQYTLNRYSFSGRIQKRSGNRHMWSHPVTIYPCTDGYVAVSAVTDDQAERLCLLMDLPDLLMEPRFKTGQDRIIHADAFDGKVLPWFKSKTCRAVVGACVDWRVPAARVNTLEDLLADPQYRARKFFKELVHPAAGKMMMPEAPFKMSRTPARLERAPLLGEHNRDVYKDRLKMTKARFQTLQGNGVI